MQQNWTTKVCVVALLLGIGLTAWAGTKIANPVVVNPTARLAYGAMGTARNSADNRQYIGCYVVSGGGAPSVRCFARDAANRSGACSSNDLDLVRVAESIASDSYINFRWNAAGTCTYLLIRTASYQAPKQP